MKVFMDMEFTGLHKLTTIISLGAVAENGKQFYRELSDFNSYYVDEWLDKNVMAHLNWQKDGNRWTETVNKPQTCLLYTSPSPRDS